MMRRFFDDRSMAIAGPYCSARLVFNRNLLKIGMKTYEISVFLQPRKMKKCNPGVGELRGWERTSIAIKDYRAGAQNGIKRLVFYPKRVELLLGNYLKGWRFRR